jgi:hypothetical protein
MPTIKAVLVIQDKKSRAAVLLDKNIQNREMSESIHALSQYSVPANKLLTLELATGSWVVKTMTDLPIGRANLAVLAHKMYPSRKKIALIGKIYDILLHMEDWHMVELIEEEIKKLIEHQENQNDESRLKQAEAEFTTELNANRMVVADIRQRFGELRIGKSVGKGGFHEMGGMLDGQTNDLPVAVYDGDAAPSRYAIQDDTNLQDPNDQNPGVLDRFQLLNGASNKVSQCMSKFPELWRKHMWFKFLVVLAVLVLVGVPVAIIIIYSQPK